MLYKLRAMWGDTLLTFNHMGIMITMVNLVLLIVTAYNTNWFQEHGMNLSIAGFAGVIAGILILGMILVKRVNIPSFFASWNEQFWGNNNPIKKELDNIKKDMVTKGDYDEVIKAINELREKIEKE